MPDLPPWVDGWCRTILGAEPVDALFRVSHLSEVVGLRLGDGREVVVKRRADESGRATEPGVGAMGCDPREDGGRSGSRLDRRHHQARNVRDELANSRSKHGYERLRAQRGERLSRAGAG
jgi:hypothetical protein